MLLSVIQQCIEKHSYIDVVNANRLFLCFSDNDELSWRCCKQWSRHHETFAPADYIGLWYAIAIYRVRQKGIPYVRLFLGQHVCMWCGWLSERQPRSVSQLGQLAGRRMWEMCMSESVCFGKKAFCVLDERFWLCEGEFCWLSGECSLVSAFLWIVLGGPSFHTRLLMFRSAKLSKSV